MTWTTWFRSEIFVVILHCDVDGTYIREANATVRKKANTPLSAFAHLQNLFQSIYVDETHMRLWSYDIWFVVRISLPMRLHSDPDWGFVNH